MLGVSVKEIVKVVWVIGLERKDFFMCYMLGMYW